MTALVLPAEIQAEIVRQALAALPRECCGLLEGLRDGGGFAVTALRAVPNLATQADRFELDPAAHLRVLREARLGGRTIIGCYHSHPGGDTAPSPRDLAGAGETDFLWLIAAPGTGHTVALAAYVFDGQGFLPLDLRPDTSLDPAPRLRV
jgi:proteasome lid subunit RPN8/RPN11